MGLIFVFLFGNTAVMAAPAIKKQAGGAAIPAKVAASSLVQTASKIEVKSFSAPVGKDIALEARLITSKGELLGGKMIEFKVNNKPIGSFPTATAGTANAGTAKAPFHVSGDYPPGVYKIEARFTGDAAAGWGTGKGDLTVVKAKTKFEMTLIKNMNPPLIGGEAHLAGYLINTANPASEIKDRKVSVRLSRGNYTETIITYKKGEFFFHPLVPLDLAALNSLDPKLPFTVEAEFGGDTYFEPTRAQFTFTAIGQPAPQIKAVERINDNYLKLKGEYFKPAQYEKDWNRWITEFKNWVFIYADDGTGLKPVPLISGRAGDINMREIGLNVKSFNLQAIKFKVVRGKQESNIFSFSYVRGKDIQLIIESIDPARTKVGDPDENAFTLKLHITSFSYLLNPGTKIMFSGERIPFKDAKFKTQSPEDKANNEGWFEFHVPVNYRHLPGPYKIQVISDKGVESNIVYWNLERVIKVNPATMKATPKKLK